MKTKANFREAVSLVMLLCSLFMFTAMSSLPLANPVGNWEYQVETPEGTLTGEMIVKKDEDSYDVLIKTQVYGDIQLEDVDYTDDVMTGSADVDGDTVEFEFEFEDDVMSGSVLVGDEEYPIEAERKKN